ncbi:PREDICTED: multiple C2 and transmembrane domain-containing protein 1-like isoform X2 [Priapulus caudatus]|uniref:Multiple C2 and transmembrane domain-containing protein 1-like isoform X2 n=1 Tax=Priapulus caudatus TaxID=37621 RepID=A0ABM1DXN5_PRICU|nr:PREDICTED: multiple C2 and transmembrane domain-containing protein 1-like isoform X2 [Priapulus caudatus]
MKNQIWSSVVTIVLVEGKNLLPMDANGLSDPYVKFRLSNEKYKSKVAFKTLNPNWLEQFDLHMFDDQSKQLEMTIWDKDIRSKDDFMGRCTIDLAQLPRERTHAIWQDLEDGAGSIHLLLTISGTVGTETISDLANYEPLPAERQAIMRRYAIHKAFKRMRDVGHLTVKVFKARDLAAADLGGKSDPFCVLELVNARLQTHTEYKTLTPEWNKIFTFNVKDIHSVLEVTVYDEDRNKTVEFLGKVAIPLLQINNGERKWYALKDKKMTRRVKGEILLEMDFVFNPVKASVRTFNPKEEKYMSQEPKFKKKVFMTNVARVRQFVLTFLHAGRFIQSCFQWESVPRSLTAFLVFVVIVYNFELYMLPVALLLVFLRNYLVLPSVKEQQRYLEGQMVPQTAGDDDESDDDKDKEERKSFKERLQAVQDVCLTVQNALGYIASHGESVKNTFNFTSPFLSYLLICVLCVGTVVLYFIPLRWIIMAWGINKFTKQLRSPNAIPNNELLDYLSRVPDDQEVMMYAQLTPEPHSPLLAKKKKSQ